MPNAIIPAYLRALLCKIIIADVWVVLLSKTRRCPIDITVLSTRSVYQVPLYRDI